MTKRNFKKTALDPFADNDATESEATANGSVDSSWLQADQSIFGEIARVEAQTERIKNYDIFKIIPDPAQPRRVMPSEIRAHWDGDPHSIPDLIIQWVRLVQAETGREFTLGAYLLSDEEQADRSSDPDPIEASFLDLVDLAVSIRRDGLTNPVTLSVVGTHYRLETGERRWLAFHLLHAFFDGQSPGIPNEQNRWRSIPARSVSEMNVWRQATENNARQNLNAIGRARQFSILMMDLWARDPRSQHRFKGLNSFKHEQAYYAQVVDLSPPRGKSEMLLSAMGFKHRNAIQRHRDLLRLPPEVWQMADDYNCPESVLRRLVKLSPDEARTGFSAWLNGERKQAIEGEISQKADIPSAPVNRPALLTDPACDTGNRLFSKAKEQEITRKLKALTQLRDGVGEAADQTKSQIRQMTADIRRLLDDIDSYLGG